MSHFFNIWIITICICCTNQKHLHRLDSFNINDFTESTLTSSNPPTFPKLEGLIATVNFSAPSAKLSSSVAILNVEEVVPAFNYYTCYSCEVCSINCYTTICKVTVKSVVGAWVILLCNQLLFDLQLHLLVLQCLLMLFEHLGLLELFHH